MGVHHTLYDRPQLWNVIPRKKGGLRPLIGKNVTRRGGRREFPPASPSNAYPLSTRIRSRKRKKRDLYLTNWSREEIQEEK